MQQVADWLQKLGLSRYAQSFAENDISFSILPDLTDQDLKELGVASLGHRRQLLRAIADLTDSEPPSSKPTAELIEPLAPRDTAERRQVTVMFSDLVGSTALSTRMDPEDLREVISAYQNCVAEIVQRFGGFVAKYMGDGVLIYFGYPQAHEDDAERAVRAGLELVSGVSALKTPEPLQTRVGVATGLVVVGDLIGSGASREQAIVGETPNLAARLQGVAEPESVVIAESTRKLVGNLFELDDLGSQELKGISGAVRAWCALRPASVESRFEALHASGLTELVGREEELELLLRRWSKAKGADGQVVLLAGEPGIGKSRLTAALLERLAPEPHTRLRYFCSPQHGDSALFPIISQMERAAAISHNDDLKTKLDKLDGVLAQTTTSSQDAGLLADMLSLPNDGRYPALNFAPQVRRQKTLEALSVQMEALSRANPVLMVLEDAHWADHTSLEAFGRAISRIRILRVLLVVTFRPEFDAPWIGQPHVMALTINRLGQREVSAMIDRLIGNKLLPPSVRQDVIERTDGIPLFVEEITKAVVEAGSEGAAERALAAVPSPGIAVPPSLHASLMARLDRLGTAKRVAQNGAAIGREFSHALLSAVMRTPEEELSSSLNRLVAAGLLFRQGTPPHSTYLFKHGLVQDAAYGTLLREPRRALHARIANVLETQFAETVENQPELLARHYTEAALIEKAAALWGKAGLRSLTRSALVEASEQLKRALDQIATLPGTRSLRREQIKLQVVFANALMHTKGHASSDTKEALDQARFLIERAEALGEPAEDPLVLFSVLYGFWVANYIAVQGDVLRELAAQFLDLAERQRAKVPLMIGHRITGVSLFYTGGVAESLGHYDKAFALYDCAEHLALATRFGQDVGVAILCYRALARWLVGYPDTALVDASRALRSARDIGQPVTLMYALYHISPIYLWSGDYTTAKVLSDELVALADTKGAFFWKALGLLDQGCALEITGQHLEASKTITTGINSLTSTGATAWMSVWYTNLANSHAELGQFGEARRCLEEVKTIIQTAKETWWEAETSRIGGEIELMSPEHDVATAEDYFEHALSVACQQQAKSWELRAAMSLARLWRDQGKPQQARELLAPVYGWFTEGFDTRDLKEAKVLLEELTS
jgi:predicted ATPase/class 3 adenylate cyclase